MPSNVWSLLFRRKIWPRLPTVKNGCPNSSFCAVPRLFWFNLMFKAPGAFHCLFLENRIDQARSADEMLAALRSRVDGVADINGLMKALR